ncbi:MAG: ribosome silencing factor [Betaproteobacteria bacterium]|nr:ribosome silencing factor [Betaproteobacteria bacterium]
MDIRKKQKAVIAALEDIKARDIAAFDVTHLTALFDRVIIATADSARQGRALAGHVHERLKSVGERIYATEGGPDSDWILVDLGDIVVHIMQPAAREYYNLEELWGEPKPRTRAVQTKRGSTRASAS